MPITHRMQFVSPVPTMLDRVGGAPDHRPSSPVIDGTGQELAFIAQFYSHPIRLPLGEKVLCIQIYQRFPVDDPAPTLISLSRSAERNDPRTVRVNPMIHPVSVCWEETEEPDLLPPWTDWGPLHEAAALSKAGGLTIHRDAITADFEFVLQLDDEPERLNLGGYSIVVSRGPDGSIVSRLD